MRKTDLYSVIILSFCSMLLDFMMTADIGAVYPRDRIIHIAISASAAFAVAMLLKNISFNATVVKITAAILIAVKMILTVRAFAEYFTVFHGSNTVGILLSAVMTSVIFSKFIYGKTHLLYSFFGMFNITLTIMIIVLSFSNLNIANIYSNSTQFVFAPEKLVAFFEIFTISLIVKDKSSRMYAQSRYIFLSAGFMAVVTLLQGLCVSGDMLYSVSPLHALAQTFYTPTVKRFDYILSIYYTLDFLGTAMLYTWAVKSIFTNSKEETNEKT